jgi:hypothetical protein
LSENQEERVETDIDNNNGDFDEGSDIAEPLEIGKEIVEVVENPDTDLSSIDQREEEEHQKNEINTDSSSPQDVYEQVKAQSIQLSSLADTVQSLQSQVKQSQETIRLRKHNKTSPVRKKSNNRVKTKKKTKRRGSARSRK